MPFDDPALPVVWGPGGGGPVPNPTPNPEDVTPPVVPTGLTATGGNLNVSLTWDANDEDDFNHFRVYRATVSGGPYNLVATLTASELVVSGLSNGTTYYFVVTGVDDSGNESAESTEASATPTTSPPGADTTPPAAPTGLGATPGDTEVVLNWNDNGEGDFDHYLVYRATVAGGPYTVIASVTASAYTATALANGTTYYFVVTALDDSDNESADSSEVSATPAGTGDVTPPAVPTGLSATGGVGQITLNWNDVGDSDLDYYKVYRATASGGPYNFLANATASAYIDSAVTAGTTYWYKVSAVDETGNESAQSTSDSASATAPSGTTIPAGANIQSYVNNNPNGTTFILAAGTWTQQRVTPKAGNTFIGTLGSSGQRLSILDGQNVTQFSIYVPAGTGTITGVTIKNIVVTRYASPVQLAAVGGYGFINGLIENVESRNNKAAGMSFGTGTTLRNCYIHHNEQIGLKADGALNAVVEGCEVSFNNYLQLFSSGWEAGGSKFVKTTNLTVRDCYVHHNHGPGLWTDFDNIDTLYEDNRVEDNHGVGIFHEISYDVIVRNNQVHRNGVTSHPWMYGAGILIAHSPNAEVHNNTLSGNGNGIAGIQQSRGSGRFGLFELRNLHVHDNDVTAPEDSYTGVARDTGDLTAIFTSKNNRFINNDYHVINLGTNHFEWNNGRRTWTYWQGTGGQDLTGSID